MPSANWSDRHLTGYSRLSGLRLACCKPILRLPACGVPIRPLGGRHDGLFYIFRILLIANPDQLKKVDQRLHQAVYDPMKIFSSPARE